MNIHKPTKANISEVLYQIEDKFNYLEIEW